MVVWWSRGGTILLGKMRRISVPRETLGLRSHVGGLQAWVVAAYVGGVCGAATARKGERGEALSVTLGARDTGRSLGHSAAGCLPDARRSKRTQLPLQVCKTRSVMSENNGWSLYIIHFLQGEEKS
jgi:hypothetical protein